VQVEAKRLLAMVQDERDHARNRQLQRFLAREHEYQQMALDQVFSYWIDYQDTENERKTRVGKTREYRTVKAGQINKLLGQQVAVEQWLAGIKAMMGWKDLTMIKRIARLQEQVHYVAKELRDEALAEARRKGRERMEDMWRKMQASATMEDAKEIVQQWGQVTLRQRKRRDGVRDLATRLLWGKVVGPAKFRARAFSSWRCLTARYRRWELEEQSRKKGFKLATDFMYTTSGNRIGTALVMAAFQAWCAALHHVREMEADKEAARSHEKTKMQFALIEDYHKSADEKTSTMLLDYLFRCWKETAQQQGREEERTIAEAKYAMLMDNVLLTREFFSLKWVGMLRSLMILVIVHTWRRAVVEEKHRVATDMHEMLEKHLGALQQTQERAVDDRIRARQLNSAARAFRMWLRQVQGQVPTVGGGGGIFAAAGLSPVKTASPGRRRRRPGASDLDAAKPLLDKILDGADDVFSRHKAHHFVNRVNERLNRLAEHFVFRAWQDLTREAWHTGEREGLIMTRRELQLELEKAARFRREGQLKVARNMINKERVEKTFAHWLLMLENIAADKERDAKIQRKGEQRKKDAVKKRKKEELKRKLELLTRHV
jgi:hypothetical protein